MSIGKYPSKDVEEGGESGVPKYPEGKLMEIELLYYDSIGDDDFIFKIKFGYQRMNQGYKTTANLWYLNILKVS